MESGFVLLHLPVMRFFSNLKKNLRTDFRFLSCYSSYIINLNYNFMIKYSHYDCILKLALKQFTYLVQIRIGPIQYFCMD